MGDKFLNDASDSVSSLPFNLGVDKVGFFRILRDVLRKEGILVIEEAVLSVRERESPLLVWGQISGSKS